MINTVSVKSPLYDQITCAYHEVDEVELHGYKGQTTGRKIYKIDDSNSFSIPKEYYGYWSQPCTWGDMIGIVDEEDLARVKPTVKVVEQTIWVLEE